MPMVSQEWLIGRDLLLAGRFVPFCDRPMQLLTLMKQQQTIGGFVSNCMLELVGGGRSGNICLDQTRLQPHADRFAQLNLIHNNWIVVVKRIVRETAADDTRHFDGQLRRRRQLVDPAGDKSMERIRKFQCRRIQIVKSSWGCAIRACLFEPVKNDHNQLFGEQRIAIRFAVNRFGKQLRDLLHVQRAAQKLLDIITAKPIKNQTGRLWQ